MSVGNLVANLTANTSGFTRGLTDARNQLSSFSSSISNLSAIGLATQGVGSLVNMAKQFVSVLSQPVKLFADFEQSQASFEVMLGSAEAATKMLGDMRNLAASTPLETKDIQQAGKTLLQFGVSAENVLPTIRMLGDVTGGDASRFKQMALAFGQMSSAGRLMGSDLLQMINAGFNPLQVISKQTGKSILQLKKQMEAGGISTEMVMKAFQSATQAGGQFHGMMGKQSKTLSGLWSTLKDNVGLALTDIGQSITEGFNLKGLLADTAGFVQSFATQFAGPISSAIGYVGGLFQQFLAAMKALFTAVSAAWAGGISALPSIWASAFGSMAETAGAFVGPVLAAWTTIVAAASSAISTLKSAWDNWLGAALAVWGEWANSTITTITQWAGIVGEVAGSWIGPLLEQIADFVANFDLYLLIGVENAKLFAANIGEYLSTMFVNSGEWLNWFADNWRSVLFTVGDYAMTIFINLGQNIRNLWTAVLDFIAGNGFRFDATPLTKGVASAIGKLPQLTEAAVNEMTPELERLYAELGQRQSDAQAKSIIAATKLQTPEIKSIQQQQLTIPDSKTSDTKPKLSGAMTFGSKEAASAIAMASSRGKDPVADNTKQTAKNTAQIVKHLSKSPLAFPLNIAEIGV